MYLVNGSCPQSLVTCNVRKVSLYYARDRGRRYLGMGLDDGLPPCPMGFLGISPEEVV